MMIIEHVFIEAFFVKSAAPGLVGFKDRAKRQSQRQFDPTTVSVWPNVPWNIAGRDRAAVYQVGISESSIEILEVRARCVLIASGAGWV